jgi:hypothetical protein
VNFVFDLDAFAEKVAEKVAAKQAPTIAAAVAQAFATRIEGKILDIPALGRRLGKSTDGARMWLSRRRGKLATVDLGGRVGVRAEDLDSYLAGSRAAPKLRAVGGGAR